MSATTAFLIIYVVGLIGAGFLGYFVAGPLGYAGRFGKAIAIVCGYAVVATGAAFLPLVLHD